VPVDLNLSLLLPEITIVAIVSFLGLLEIFQPELSDRFTTQLNLSGTLLVAAALAFLLNAQGTAFGGMFTLDALALFFKFLFLAAAAWVFVVKEEDRSLKDAAEFPLILWSALLGMFFLVSSKDFLLFFISLELVTLSIYILASYTRRNLSSIEAGLKYLILGSLASAFLLYGISLIYASSVTLSFYALG
jgi:NADH-quinone oxidoreductase subunit N